MDYRPVRVYLFEYLRETAPSDAPQAHRMQRLVATGVSPCRAKNAAFEQLERKLKTDNLPRDGWRLFRQTQLHAGGV